MKRIFIAIKVEAAPELLRMISSLKVMLGNESIKWIDPSNIHLTLAFLGDTEEKRIKIMSNMLKEICCGFQEFGFTLAGTGIFRNLNDPKVLWAGIRSPEKLSELNELITAGLTESGFYAGDKQFKPHLTIGRIKSIRDIDNLKNAIDKFRECEFQEVAVNEVILYESVLMHPAPLYKPLGKFGCKKPFIK